MPTAKTAKHTTTTAAPMRYVDALMAEGEPMTAPRFTRPAGVWTDPPLARQGLGTTRLRPSFLIVGAQRSGTTSLYRALMAHPRILPAMRKEVHYFDFQYHKGAAWYLAHFPPSSRWSREQGVLTGEASPYYFVHPLAPERACAFDPTMRIIAILRDPVLRAFSHYRHNRARGQEPLGFEEALAAEPDRLAADVDQMTVPPHCYSRSHHLYSYADRGRYACQLERWLKHFPAKQVLVIEAQALFASPTRTVAAVFAFLSLPAPDLPTAPHLNRQPPTTLPHDVHTRVARGFATDQHRLRTLVRHRGVACIGTSPCHSELGTVRASRLEPRPARQPT